MAYRTHPSSGGSSSVATASPLQTIPSPVGTGLSSAQQGMEFTGLAGDTDGGYRSYHRIYNISGATRTYQLRVNGATTSLKWLRHGATNAPATLVDEDTSGGLFMAIEDGCTGDITIEIGHAKTGRFRHFQIHVTIQNGTEPQYQFDVDFTWMNSANEITSFGIFGSHAQACGASSMAKVFTIPDA